ncbi:hypothetical protein MN608_09769 [Microdochium nivale]|nr:hypothetical protein MN608_09769 [Microdochium nivale]
MRSVNGTMSYELQTFQVELLWIVPELAHSVPVHAAACSLEVALQISPRTRISRTAPSAPSDLTSMGSKRKEKEANYGGALPKFSSPGSAHAGGAGVRTPANSWQHTLG